MAKKNFDVTGMSCSACSARVEKAVSHLNGVQFVNVNLLKNSMVVDYDETKLQLQDIVSAVTDAGYGASEKRTGTEGTQTPTEDPAAGAKKETEAMKRRLWISLFFALLLMILAMGPMLGMPLPSWMSGPRNAPINALTQFLLALPVVFVNFKYFSNGFKALIDRAPNMDSLVAIGSAASVLFGLFALYRMLYGLSVGDEALLAHYAHNLYFDSAAMILALITLGKFFESRAKHKTTDAISKLMALVPETAFVEKDGVVREVPIAQIHTGDVVVLKTGSRVPVDGGIIEGACSVDESSLTGESLPVDKSVGEEVSASVLVSQGFAKIRATRVGDDTSLAQIIKLVDEATSTKPPVARLADKISGIFVPTVISISVIAAGIWMLLGYSWEFAVMIGVSVLVISCPCALGLATPTAIMVGTGKGAQNGILFRSAEAIEAAEKIDTIVLDKTGTVTSGKPVLTDVISFSETPERLLTLAAAVEEKSEHPLAYAIVEGAKAQGLTLPETQDFSQKFGKVEGTADGLVVSIGNQTLLKTVPQEVSKLSEELANQGKTPLFVLIDGHLAGILGAADAIREDSRVAIESFKKSGKEVWMLTGDNERTANAVAAKVGIEHVKAGVRPAEKEALIRELQAKGRKVMMVGDGINDAPSLVRADVGAAIGAGTDVAIEAADIVIMRSRLTDVANAMALSASTMRNIRENLFWAFIYNVIGIPVAAGVFYPFFGWVLNPMIAAAAMSMSSVSVVSNALRLRSWKPKFRSAGQDEQTVVQAPIMRKTVLAVPAAETSRSEPQAPYSYAVKVDGMMCGHCVKAVTKLLESLGAQNCVVSLEQKSARFTSEKPISEEAIAKALESEGYELKSVEEKLSPKPQCVTLTIEGMTCEHCSAAVRKALSAVEGVSRCEVNLEKGAAVVCSEAPLNPEELKKAVAEAGYEVKDIR